MRHLVLSTLSIALLAACAHKVAEEPAEQSADATLDSIEVTGSRVDAREASRLGRTEVAASAPMAGMPAPLIRR